MHARSKLPRTTRHGGHHRAWFAAISVTALAVVAVGVAALVVHGPGLASPGQAATTTTAAPPPVLAVSAVSPAAGATGVDPGATVTVTFSTPVSPTGPMPTLSPAVAGAWVAASPTVLTFVATAPFVPSTTETLTVPGGSAGVQGSHGQTLAAPATSTFTVAPGSELRLQQLLAQLNYLPVSFTPSTTVSPSQAADPAQGTFAWRWTPQPWLAPLWTQGTTNVLTTGAVMAFEDQHGLTTDGIAGPQVWTALLQAAATNATDPNPYDYVYVSKSLPESATVFRNGAQVYSTPANTGVPGATTASGTFPVYLRYKVTTMSGTNPDGTKYHDPGIPWVSYFNGGDALHGFVRPGYGYPQSDGCVEMPPANAAVVWPMTPIGTPVTVS
jgi:peptidoglycan hydrolase-like protein with peptidoglycan-binding domain